MALYSSTDIKIIASDIPGAEGIAIANDGRIFIGAEDGWVYSISPEEVVSRHVKLPGRPLGISIDRNVNLFVCDWEAHAVFKIRHDGEIALLADSDGEHRMQFPNFCVFDDQGNLYVSDTGTSRRNEKVRVPDGKVFRISPSGRCELFADGLYQPNGLAIRRGDSAIYVIQTMEDNLLRLEITPDGTCGKREMYAKDLDGSPDGMAFLENGDLLVVTGLKEILYLVHPSGQTEIFLEDARAEKLVSPANPAFGGRYLNELYVTNLMGNSVSRITGPLCGQPLYHQA
jgi:sugar lactone lactonase YvrE